MAYFSILKRLKLQTYLLFFFYLFQDFKQIETPDVTCFAFLNTIRPQPYLSSTLLKHFQQHKTQVVPYFRILNSLKPQTYLIFVFEHYKTPALPQPYLSFSLCQHFQKDKTVVVPYLSILNRLKPSPYLILALSGLNAQTLIT